MGAGYHVEPDRGFAWVVLVSGFLNYMISTGVAINVCSVYLAAMIEAYGCSRAEVYVAGALSSGLFSCSAPVASLLIEKAGLRAAAVVGAILTSSGLVLSANVTTLVCHYITFSVTAIGCGVMYQSSLVVPVHYFVKRRSLASAAVFGAGGVSTAFLNIARLIIDAYTWRPSFYIIAAIVLNTCVFSMLIRPTSLLKNDDIKLRQKIHNESITEVGESKTDVTSPVLNCDEEDNQAISHASPKAPFIDDRDPNYQKTRNKDLRSESRQAVQTYLGLVGNQFFWLLLADCFLFYFALLSTTIIMPDMYAVGGMNDWQTNVLFILWGIANTLGRALSGVLWLRLASPLVVFCSANLVWATSMLLFLGNTHFVCLVFANLLTGLGQGSFITCFSMVAADLVGVKLANRAIGLCLLSAGVGGFVAPSILGKLFDATASYVWPMLLAAMVGFASFADLLLILCLQKGKKKRRQYK